MKERLILARRLSAAILAALLFAACPTEPEQYTVTFDVGAGGGKPLANRTVTDGDWLTLPDQGTMTAPSGKAFLGWKSSSDSTIYKAWESVKITGDMVFTAQWGTGAVYTGMNTGVYTASFRVGKRSGSTSASQNITAGTNIPLPGQGAMRVPSGKTFLGWNIDSASAAFKSKAMRVCGST